MLLHPFPVPILLPSLALAAQLTFGPLVRVGQWIPTVFNSCVNELEQGKRLENLSWRTWSRERTLYSRQRYSRLPLLDDDEAESRSPALTEDEDDGDGDSSNDSSGSDDSSDDAQSHQQQQQQHTKHLAPVSSVTVTVTSPVVAAPAAVAATATAEVVAVAVAPVVVATAAQSTTGSEQQHPLVTTPTTPSTPGSSGSQSRQHHHHHHHHQCSASHPATGTHPKLLANPPPRRHYSHSLPYTMVAAAAAASVSPPIGQLIKRVIFNQSATMMTMTHNIGASSSVCLRPRSRPSVHCHLTRRGVGALRPRDSLPFARSRSAALARQKCRAGVDGWMDAGGRLAHVPSSDSHSQIALNTLQASISPTQRLNYMLLLSRH